MAREEACHIGPNVVIRGTIRGEGALRISGEVHGEVHTDGDVLIESGGSVFAQVAGANIVVRGSVQGPLTAARSVALERGADVRGDLSTQTLRIEEGARFEGSISMNAATES